MKIEAAASNLERSARRGKQILHNGTTERVDHERPKKVGGRMCSCFPASLSPNNILEAKLGE